MRFVRSTPPPLLTALSCLETPLERQAVVSEQVVDQSSTAAFFNQRRTPLSLPVLSANYKLRGEHSFFFPYSTPRHYPPVENHI